MKTILVLGFLCLATPITAQAQWNFELGNLDGWSATGTAFANQPTLGDNVAARMPGTQVGQQGEYWIGTFENRHTMAEPAGRTQGDAPMGTLTSEEFTINRRSITFLIGGGNDYNSLRVELLIRTGRPGDPVPPRETILGLLGIGEIVTLSDGTRYFVATLSTGRATELMRREIWDVGSFMGTRARIRIKDLSNRPWGHINVDDINIVDDVRVHVTDASGDVAGSEVFVNGVRMGVTDASGILNLPPQVTAGSQLVARKLVLENPSFRLNHAAGSTLNWNYRVYVTSMAVENTGTTSAFSVVNPLITQELRLNRNNTLIGIHLVVSTEWDATTQELASIRDEKLGPASQYLYNVTDGQFFIEQVELMSNAESWFDADVLVFANSSLRENTFGSAGGFLNPCLCTGIRLQRGTDFRTYDHEFGHYGFGLLDEYWDSNDASCTASVSDPTIADFGKGHPKASCMMFREDFANKLCSNRPENPHMGGTLQGPESCWSQLSRSYQDRSGTRWSIQTPETRLEIPGMLPNLLSGWEPRVAIRNNPRTGLCLPFELPTVTDALFGRPLANFEIWNTTFYGHSFLEGKTGMDGRISVTGVHVGDILTGRGGVRFDVPFCTLASLAKPQDLRAEQFALFRPSTIDFKVGSFLNGSNLFGLEPQKGARELVARPEPFNLKISFVPTPRAGEGEVRIASDKELAKTPQVVFSLIGTAHSQEVSMEFDASKDTYVGLVTKLPIYTQANIRVRAFTTKNEVVDRLISVSVSPIVPKGLTELGSTDGRLALAIPNGALPPNSYVAIGPADVPDPSLGEGMVIVDGPFSVFAGAALEFRQPIFLRFQLTSGTEKANSGSQFETKSFDIRHYNPETKAWESLGGVFLPGVNIVSVSTKQLGAYALVARPTVAPVKTRKIKDRRRKFLTDNDSVQDPLSEGCRALLAMVESSQTRIIL